MSKKKRPTRRKLVSSKTLAPAHPRELLTDIRALVDQTRDATARAVNSALVLLYWSVGDRIRRDILKEKRAGYGEQIVPTLSAQLAPEYGTGFGTRNLFRMIQFAELFPDRAIVSALSAQLGWSHFIELLPMSEPLKRDFYAEMCRVERWSVRTLREKIGGMLYERTALSRKPAELAKNELAKLRATDQLSPDLVFRDPYFLDFLGLKDTYAEKDLEAAILSEIEGFLLELGGGFTFVARQRRMVIDCEDHSLDLLFYHRKLRRLIAVDLKLGRFEAAFKGQMELYLRWLDRHEREPGEESPLGLILCESAGEEQVELLQLGASGILLLTGALDSFRVVNPLRVFRIAWDAILIFFTYPEVGHPLAHQFSQPWLRPASVRATLAGLTLVLIATAAFSPANQAATPESGSPEEKPRVAAFPYFSPPVVPSRAPDGDIDLAVAEGRSVDHFTKAPRAVAPISAAQEIASVPPQPTADARSFEARAREFAIAAAAIALGAPLCVYVMICLLGVAVLPAHFSYFEKPVQHHE